MAEIALAEAIQTLRTELQTAFEEGEGKAVRFKPGPIDLEFDVQVDAEGKGKAGFKFWVVSIGGEASIKRSGTHKLKMTLHPVDSGGRTRLISSRGKGRPG